MELGLDSLADQQYENYEGQWAHEAIGIKFRQI